MARKLLKQPDPAEVQSFVDDSPARGFAAAFSEAQDIIAIRVRLGAIWPLWEILEDKSAKPMALVQKFLEPILTTAIEKAQKQAPINTSQSTWGKDDDPDDGETLLDHLIKHTQGK